MDYSKRKLVETHELLFELKCVAIKPRSSKLLPRIRRQLLASKKVLFFHNTDIPWKKRKFHQLMQRTSTATTNGSVPKKPKVQLKEEQTFLPVSRTGLRSCVNSEDGSNQISANASSRNRSLRSRRRNISRMWTTQTITQGNTRDWSGDKGNVVQEFDDDSTNVYDELDTQTLLDGSVRLLVSGDGLRTDVVHCTFQDEVMQSWEPYYSNISPILDSHDSVGSSEITNPPDAKTLDGPVALLVSDDCLQTEVVRPTFQDETMQNCDSYNSISPKLATDDPDCSSEVSDPPPGIMTLDGSVTLLVSSDGLHTEVVRPTLQDETMQSCDSYNSISPKLATDDPDCSSEVSDPPPGIMTLDGSVTLLVSSDGLHMEVVRPTLQDETMRGDPYNSISPKLATDDPDCSSEVSDPPPGIMALDGSVTLLVSSDGLHTEVVRPTFQDEPMQSWEPYANFSPILIPNDSDSSSEISSPIVCRREDKVANWIGQQNFDNALDVSKWLGTKVVPNEGEDMETNSELMGSERPTSISCEPPDYMECINDEFEFRSSELEKSLLSTLVDHKVSCYDLQAKVAINSSLEEDEPMRSSEPDKTIELVLDLNDSVDSGSSYEPTPTNRSRKSDKIISSILISDDDPIDNAKTSKVTRRSGRLSNFLGDSVVRTTIPLSDRFQADLPKWIGANDPHYNLESSKWLGTKIWPSESGNMDTDMGLIGKGRSDLSCSCDCPDSTECIKHHIYEKRRQLQSDIGDAFYSWGFDKMGEAVSGCWTLQEQNNFKSLFKRKTTMSKGTFWRRAFKRLPFKSRESIVSYYFNVFVLKNVRMQSRLHPSDIDSDDDEEANKVLHNCKSSKVAWLR